MVQSKRQFEFFLSTSNQFQLCFSSLCFVMNESRTSPRSNVSWRSAILISPGNIVASKILNFSGSGIQVQCAHLLKDGQIYQMMMEVPDQRDASQRTQVICKATCLYSILSGSEYRAGMKYFDVPSQHQALLNSWGGKVAVTME